MVLVVVHAGIFIGALYYGESALTGMVHSGLMLAVGLGAVAGVLAMAKNALFLVQKAQVRVVGQQVVRSAAPELWGVVEAEARRLGATVPDNIVLGLDANFFVTEGAVVCLDGQLRGCTLYCSMPLSRILTVDEFRGIVGHELGHFKGDDTKFSVRFYPIYRGTNDALDSLQIAGSRGAGALALFPAMVVLTYFLESFAVAENLLSRERELAADKCGADLTSARVMAASLVKLHAFTKVWNGFDAAAAEALKAGNYYINASTLFAAVARTAGPSSLEGIASVQISHPTDTHPPLLLRLKALGVELADVAQDALAVSPDAPAISLVASVEEREQAVSQAYQMLVAHRAGIRLSSSSAGRAS